MTSELGKLIENDGAAMRWLGSTKQATQDENMVLGYARRLHGVA